MWPSSPPPAQSLKEKAILGRSRFPLKEYHQPPKSWIFFPSLFCLFSQYLAHQKAYFPVFIQSPVILGKMSVPSS